MQCFDTVNWVVETAVERRGNSGWSSTRKQTALDLGQNDRVGHDYSMQGIEGQVIGQVEDDVSG